MPSENDKTKPITATVIVEINAPSAHVWNALITPEIIKQYLFGTDTECDWKPGCPIYFRGEYQGKKYEDKGVILQIQAETLLQYSYWSSMSGTPDLPENYATVTFTLSRIGSSTQLTLHQDGLKNEEARLHSEQNWGFVLESLKTIVEKK